MSSSVDDFGGLSHIPCTVAATVSDGVLVDSSPSEARERRPRTRGCPKACYISPAAAARTPARPTIRAARHKFAHLRSISCRYSVPLHDEQGAAV